MAELKLTKNELRSQQGLLKQLQRYLPTLQLKKAMLQAEVRSATLEIQRLENEAQKKRKAVHGYAELLLDRTAIDPTKAALVERVKKTYENFAGVEVPIFEGVDFQQIEYSLFATPPWVDSAIEGLQAAMSALCEVTVAEEKRAALQRELREVSIRVNLFEKVLIPRCKTNIKKIRVFLGDQELAAVGQAKVAKSKIEKRKELAMQETADAR